jgi:transposase
MSTKLSVRCDGQGLPLVFTLQPGHRHESLVFETLMDGGAIRRPGRGRPRLRPKRLCGDKAYSNHRIRRWCRQRGVRVTIPRTANERRRGPFNRDLYRQRARVEQLFNRLKQYRRVATRYEKRASNYRGMVTIAAIRLFL